MPVIGYAVQAVEPYVEKIIVVTHPSNSQAILDAAIGSLNNSSTQIESAVQENPLGMGHAIRCGLEKLERDYAVVVIAGDNIVLDSQNVKNVFECLYTSNHELVDDQFMLAWDV